MMALAHVILYLCTLQCAVYATYSNNYISPLQYHYQYAQPNLLLPYSVVAHFDMNGIRGNVTFSQANYYAQVSVVAKFDGLDQFGADERWGWHIHDFPVNFAMLEEFPCSTSSVGGHFDPDNRISNANYSVDCSPETMEECELGDLSGRFGQLLPSQNMYQFRSEDSDVNLYGPDSFVGRSIVLHRADGFRVACANIEYNGHNRLETFIARFPNDIYQQQNTLQGDIVLRRSSKRLGMSFMGLLFRVDGGPVDTSHNWNLRTGTCDSLSNDIWGPSLSDPTTAKLAMDCSTSFHRHCRTGDLTGKCNPLESDASGRIKFFCTDTQLSITPNFDPIGSNDPGSLSLVVEEEAASGGGVLACSAFELLPEKAVRAMISQRVSYLSPAGRTRWLHRTLDLKLHQRGPFDPTYIRLRFSNLPQANEFGEISYLQIRERPVGADGNCSNLGPVFESRPYFDTETGPLPDGIIRTGEEDFIGNLRNKIPLTNAVTRRSSYLPLFGPHSVVGRSLVLHDSSGAILGCGNLDETSNTDLRLSLSGYYKKK